ncbi:hypothetical protein E1508_06840 [Pseudomonas moraviensis]|nr:hypothetical protein E1508_06840 [Pseudomonas moraviensis]
MIVPTLCVGMHPVTLCVTGDAERPGPRYHAERGNDQVNGTEVKHSSAPIWPAARSCLSWLAPATS